jgi:hypothetical protein
MNSFIVFIFLFGYSRPFSFNVPNMNEAIHAISNVKLNNLVLPSVSAITYPVRDKEEVAIAKRTNPAATRV